MAVIEIKMDNLFNIENSTINRISNYASRIIIDRMVVEMRGLKNLIQSEIRKPKAKFRRYYSRKHGKKFHWSSPPSVSNSYAPPSEDTGTLRRGVRVHLFNNEVILENRTKYAKYVEFGKNKRPHFYHIIVKYWKSPTFKKTTFQLTEAIKNSIQANIIINS